MEAKLSAPRSAARTFLAEVGNSWDGGGDRGRHVSARGRHPRLCCTVPCITHCCSSSSKFDRSRIPDTHDVSVCNPALRTRPSGSRVTASSTCATNDGAHVCTSSATGITPFALEETSLCSRRARFRCSSKPMKSLVRSLACHQRTDKRLLPAR